MLGRDEVKGGAAESPIVITPALPGHFVWLSRQSGVYLPDGAPPLGANYAITTRPDLKAADQKPIGADLRAVVRTPPFSARTLATGVYDQENVSPKPEVRIVFNAAVEPKSAEGFLKFIAETGEQIGATVSHATVEEFMRPPEPEDWEERWRLAHEPAAPENADKESQDRVSPNTLEIRPVTNLTSGKKWRLEISPGLPARSGKYQLAETFRVPLGVVKPFVLTTLTASSYINSGRSLTLEFSRSLAPDIDSESAPKYFRIEPTVGNLRFEENSDSLVVRGNFERDKEYHLQIDPAVISADGQPLGGNQRLAFKFAPVHPRLYLPEITGHQIRSGNRSFEVRAANLKSIRVTARLVAPSALAKAIAAFAKYDRSAEESSAHAEDWELSDEVYQKLPPELIEGKLIAEETIPLSPAEIDAPQKAILEWDKIVGATNAGAIFLTVEGDPLVEMGSKRPGAQALIQLTDLGVLWKKVEGEVRAYVFSHKSGQPLPGVQVGLLSKEFAPLQNATTDSSGWAKIPATTSPGWLVAQKGGDAHALRLGEYGGELPMFAFNIPVNYPPWDEEKKTSASIRAFIFTDRPLYQSGEEVKVKGFVRRSASGLGMQAVPNGEGVLVLFDPRGQEVSQTKVRTDARGSLDASIKLNSFATGNYSVRLKILEEDEERGGASCGFQLAAYQPNAFELEVATPKRLSFNEPLRVPVTAKYFFGAPITKAEARWTLRYLREPFSPDSFSGFRFGRSDESKENALTLRGTAPLTAEGATIQPKLPTPEGVPHAGVLTVEVTDANQQTVSETSRFIQDASQFYLGLAEAESSVVNVGEEIIARAVAVQPDGEPAAAPTKVKAEFIRIKHETVRMQGAGNAITFRTETSEEKIAEASGETIIPIKRGEYWRASSEATARFKANKAGQYRIRVSAKDANGQDVVSESEIFVEGSEAMAWDYRNPAQIDLVPDKAEYRAGETARILVKTPISGDALVSIEREEKVLRRMRVHLEGNAPAIEVPITAADAPNIFASLVILRGSDASTRKFKTPEYRYGVCMLRVLNPANRLQVAISPVRAEVQPGDEVEADVLVRDGFGQTLRDAEVTFFAVDDGILALTGYERPMPLAKFEEPVDLQVRTGLTLFDLLPEDPGDLRFSNKGYLIGGGGTEGPGTKTAP